MTPSLASPAPPTATRPRRALLAGSAGNFVEWYEFGVYGCFATVIAAHFFTPATASGSGGAGPLIATYASFALAFFFRPVGALLFGRLGDRVGRRPVLVLVIGLMTCATTLIGLLPTQATAGAAAPWLLTLLRALQGLSAGGEFGGAVALMTECAPPGRRGRYGAWQSFTVALGLLAGAGTAALLATVLSPAALHEWGWRVPFLLALPLGLAVLRLRTGLVEPQGPAAAPGAAVRPGVAVRPGAAEGTGGAERPGRTARPGRAGRPWRTAWPRTPSAAAPCLGGSGARPAAGSTARAVVLGIGRITGWSAAGYTFLVVLPSYLQSTLGASFQEALIATTFANLGFAASILPAGALSDRVGRRPVMLCGALAVALFALPLLHVLQDPGTSTPAKAAALVCAGATVGLLAGPGPAMLAEMFPARVRCTGLGVAYALANAVFAGCAGLVITALTDLTGSTDIPAYYAAGACALSAAALATLRGDDHLVPLR
ncbi:MFS transporter [Streptomyces sp. H27-S2]|uniref:MFS transporter n=1 Tax=Streptomyces antarcticus TaxID=2996458 RepID=UPI00226DD353|nr:MFS transporter [Streptomyces sp. H27-S2]MCY0949693.1 MFS transporter [Streptomyces sp. H27-S2]